MMQPGVLAEIGKNRRFRDSGLLGRCLFVVPKSNVGSRDVRNHIDVPADIKQDWEAGVFRLLEGRLEPVEAPRTLVFGPEARECWLNFFEEIERQQGEGGALGHVADWSSKLPGAVARIAGLLHLATRGGEVEVIERDPVERAVELGKLLIPHALAAFGLMGRAPVEDDAHALLGWIRAGRRLKFTAREVQRAMRVRFPTRAKLDQALAFLGDWRVIVKARPVPAGASGGRPTMEFVVNQRVLGADDR
jgi:putative DNA primase/helicase